MMQLWTFTVTAEIAEDGSENATYAIDGEVQVSELIGQLEIIKAQILAEAIIDEGELDED